MPRRRRWRRHRAKTTFFARCHAGPGMDARIQRYELRKTEVKCGATVDSGLGPDFTPVAMDDALDGGKADARARKLSLRMQALEGAEEPGCVARVEAGAVVANEINGPAGAVDTRPEFDVGAHQTAGELPCV